MTDPIERASALCHGTERQRLIVSMAYDLDQAIRRAVLMAQDRQLYGYAQGVEGLRAQHEWLFEREVKRLHVYQKISDSRGVRTSVDYAPVDSEAGDNEQVPTL